jgi:Ca2+/Na+ antiporter
MIRRLYIAILIYIICLFLIFLFKPAFLFDTNGDTKHFSYEDSDTSASLLSIEVVLIMIALFSYFMVIAIELISN